MSPWVTTRKASRSARLVLAAKIGNLASGGAVASNTDAELRAVVVHIGIRGIGAGEIVIAKDRYDGLEFVPGT
jgi:hypothetical protein